MQVAHTEVNIPVCLGPTPIKNSVKLSPSLFSLSFCTVLFIYFPPLLSLYSSVCPFLFSICFHICVTLVMGLDCTAQHANIR